MSDQKNLKYHDLPWSMKSMINASGPGMHPRRTENPTVKHILDRLKASEQRSLLANAPVSAKRTRIIIVKLENYLSTISSDVVLSSESPEPPSPAT